MKGAQRIINRPVFMAGLKSVTLVRFGAVKYHIHSDSYYTTYATTRHSRNGTPLLSFSGIDFVKTKVKPIWPFGHRHFAEIEVLDFDGGSHWTRIQPCWTVGPQTSGWGPVDEILPMRVHLGPRRKCVHRAKWRCYTPRFNENIWYAM